jgi:NAD(P)-dependent dehydrogenase (short-subunit alcohol dehydrogenase family)
VRACAAQFEALRPRLPRGGALSALLLNAGVLGMPFGAYSPGAEPALQVNLLGHALLHELLRPALEAADDARVVVVASGSHWWIDKVVDMARELPPRREGFDFGRAYGFSNLCRILWARALSRRVAYPVVSLHPASGPPTDAGRNMGLAVLLSVLSRVLRWEFRGLVEFQSVGKGARTQMFAAVAPRAVVAELSGRFLSGNETDGPLGCASAPSPLAQRDDLAAAVLAFVDAFVARERGA